MCLINYSPLVQTSTSTRFGVEIRGYIPLFRWLLNVCAGRGGFSVMPHVHDVRDSSTTRVYSDRLLEGQPRPAFQLLQIECNCLQD